MACQSFKELFKVHLAGRISRGATLNPVTGDKDSVGEILSRFQTRDPVLIHVLYYVRF